MVTLYAFGNEKDQKEVLAVTTDEKHIRSKLNLPALAAYLTRVWQREIRNALMNGGTAIEEDAWHYGGRPIR